jgi:flagellar secretion chaperone FliS
MSYGRQASRYRDTEVLTATPAQLVVLLYDHLLASLHRSRAAMDARNDDQLTEQLDKSRNVLTELLVTLDRERGGEVASNLAALYSFLLGELVQVGVRGDKVRLERVTKMIAELRDAFAQLATPAAVAASAHPASVTASP